MNAYELIPANPKNFAGNKRALEQIAYIVIHYTANKYDTARSNCRFFQNAVTKTSGHFFVDGKEILQSVPLDHAAWHCGGQVLPGVAGGEFYGKCTNSNSISVELCGTGSTSEEILPDQATVDMAIGLVKELMTEFGIPAQNVIRHWDVTRKQCPFPSIWLDDERWEAEFKSRLTEPELFTGFGIKDGGLLWVEDGVVKRSLLRLDEIP